MAIMPTILYPVCIVYGKIGLVQIAANSITGGIDSDDYIAKLTFRLKKNDAAFIEYSYTMDRQISDITSQSFNVSIGTMDIFTWEISVESKASAEIKITGVNTYNLVAEPDTNIFIGHIGSYSGVTKLAAFSHLQTVAFDKIIISGDYSGSSNVIVL